MRSRKNLLLIICFLALPLLTSCWNYREIDKLSIAAGVAIDKDESGGYKVSIEIIKMSGGKDSKMEPKIIQTHGETIFNALRNALAITAPRIYWSHAAIVIVSEEVAREGVLEIIDFIYRDSETRTDMNLLVSQADTAYDVLQSKSINTEIRSYEIREMLKWERVLAKTPQVKVYEFYNAVAGEGKSAVMAAVNLKENNRENVAHLNGTAIFNQDKLAGYLSEEETLYFLYITDKLKTGVLPLDIDPGKPHNKMTFEIFETRTSLKPVYENGELAMEVNIQTEVNLSENGTLINYMEESGQIIIKKKLEEVLKSKIQYVIKKVQTEWGLDIFGFGSKVHGGMPNVWRNMGGNWKAVFSKLKSKVNLEIVLRNSSHVSNPLKLGD